MVAAGCLQTVVIGSVEAIPIGCVGWKVMVIERGEIAAVDPAVSALAEPGAGGAAAGGGRRAAGELHGGAAEIPLTGSAIPQDRLAEGGCLRRAVRQILKSDRSVEE